MNDLQSQHPRRRIIEVADESLTYRQVTVEDNTPTGAQISAASGFKPDQLPVVLMLLSDGSLEDIRPDEVVDLGSQVRRFIIVESDRTYLFTIDGTRMEWPCRLITGYVVRKLGNVDDNKNCYWSVKTKLILKSRMTSLSIWMGMVLSASSAGRHHGN